MAPTNRDISEESSSSDTDNKNPRGNSGIEIASLSDEDIEKLRTATEKMSESLGAGDRPTTSHVVKVIVKSEVCSCFLTLMEHPWNPQDSLPCTGLGKISFSRHYIYMAANHHPHYMLRLDGILVINLAYLDDHISFASRQIICKLKRLCNLAYVLLYLISIYS